MCGLTRDSTISAYHPIDGAESVSKSQDPCCTAERRPRPMSPLRPYLAILLDAIYTMSGFRRHKSARRYQYLSKSADSLSFQDKLDKLFSGVSHMLAIPTIWRVFMSPYWRTTACRHPSGLTISSGCGIAGFLPEIRPDAHGAGELCRFRREIARKESVGRATAAHQAMALYYRGILPEQ